MTQDCRGMISVFLIGFCGFLAVYPSLTAVYYSTASLGANYRLVYQAYGLSAFVGPFIVTNISFSQEFFVAALSSECCYGGLPGRAGDK
ncbi:hypothetical protein [Paenibacillus sp. sgz5001063]|uniref:hypothetical protein n=1 Tax=Paenibacillus sp. sgz5001063 TaxID=3242474 RepID=UPI0036D20B6C